MSNERKLENNLKRRHPRIFLKDVNTVDPLEVNKKKHGSRFSDKDLYLIDLQTLLGSLLCNKSYVKWPRWCLITKLNNISSVNLIVVDGISMDTWSDILMQHGESKTFKKYFDLINSKLDRNVNFVNPKSYGLSWKAELFDVPIQFLSSSIHPTSGNELQLNISRKRSNEKINKSLKLDFTTLRKKFQLDTVLCSNEISKNIGDVFPRTQLLLNLEQMEAECISQVEMKNHSLSNKKYSKPDGYKPVTDSSPIFTIDCEMVQCKNPKTGEVTKNLACISIIDENRETVYHKYVKPKNLIVNYLTKYSGITPEIMKSTTATLENVQNDLAKIIPPDAIFAGHSIGNDLKALELFHPYLIDTSVIYNLTGVRKVKSKLKDLCDLFLNREIQNHKVLGHQSVEDAVATMDLVRLKLSKSIHFGDATVEDYSDDDISFKLPNLNVHCTISDENVPCLLSIDELAIGPVFTTNPVHIKHKNMFEKCRKNRESVNLLHSLLPSLKSPVSCKIVASLNDTDGFKKPWFPEEFHQFLKDQKTEEIRTKNEPMINRPIKLHPLNIMEINCKTLDKNELPSKKWISKLLKKVITEFNKFPDHSFGGLLFTDGEFDSSQKSDNLGTMYFGITPQSASAS